VTGGRGVVHLTALVPVRPNRVEPLRATLCALPTGSDSPFAAVPGTHFARFVVVDRLGARGSEPDMAIDPPRLLVAINCDGSADRYLVTLCSDFGPMTDRIFGECEGFAGSNHPSAFAAWLRSYEVAPTLPFATVDAPADRIRTATVARDRLSAFAVRTQGLEPKALRDAWREEFGW
jgi:hypothetical protein